MTQTRNLENFETAAWQQTASEASPWDETAAYLLEYAPGPWLDPMENFEEVAVKSGF